MGMLVGSRWTQIAVPARRSTWLRRVGLSTAATKIVVAVLAFAIPSIADLCGASCKRRAFGWVAADTFYYLTVARNAVRYGRVAYDQVHPNNGFHPLWQIICTGLAAIAGLLHSDDWLVPAVVWVGIAFIALAIPLLGRSLAADGHLSVFFPLLPVGVYALAILPA